MSNVIGGEIGQLQSLSQTFTREAGDVDRLMTHITNALGDTVWHGPAADRFRAAWENEFKKSLTALREALGEAAREVSNRREALVIAGS